MPQVDLVEQRAIYFDGYMGITTRIAEIPDHMKEEAVERRQALIEALADVDDEIAELFLMEEDPDVATIKAAIRRQVIALKFVPVMVGSALKNTGVQPLLDAVVEYLPNPEEVTNIALDAKQNEAEIELNPSDPDAPFVGLAFKIEKGRFGQLTYVANLKS